MPNHESLEDFELQMAKKGSANNTKPVFAWISTNDMPKYFESTEQKNNNPFSRMVAQFAKKYPEAVKDSKSWWRYLRSDYLDKFQAEYNLIPFTQDSCKTDDWLSASEINKLVNIPWNHQILKESENLYQKRGNFGRHTPLAQVLEKLQDKYPDIIKYKFGKNGLRILCVRKDKLDEILKILDIPLRENKPFVSATEILRQGFIPFSRLRSMMSASSDDVWNAFNANKDNMPKDATKKINDILYFNYKYIDLLSKLSGIKIKESKRQAFQVGVLNVLQHNRTPIKSDNNIEM